MIWGYSTHGHLAHEPSRPSIMQSKNLKKIYISLCPTKNHRLQCLWENLSLCFLVQPLTFQTHRSPPFSNANTVAPRIPPHLLPHGFAGCQHCWKKNRTHGSRLVVAGVVTWRTRRRWKKTRVFSVKILAPKTMGAKKKQQPRFLRNISPITNISMLIIWNKQMVFWGFKDAKMGVANGHSSWSLKMGVANGYCWLMHPLVCIKRMVA